MIINPYVPKNFGKEYFRLRGGSFQYSMFISVALGIKPSYDDWLPVRAYDKYVKVCKHYDLFVDPEVVFCPITKKKKEIVGGSNITSTFFEGKKFTGKEDLGTVHVFVAKSKEKAQEAKKFGWYPLVINGRSINKPFVDHLRFGKKLGFPDCCIDFFKKYNNWHLYNHPYEAFKNTPGKTGSLYCNNFFMNNTYSYIHHIPCSYICKRTKRLAKIAERKIREVEPQYVEETNEILKKPLLVFAENDFIIFDGILHNNSIKYTECEYYENLARKEEKIDFFDSIKLGNKISLQEKELKIFQNHLLLKTINRKQDWFMIGFE